MNAMAGISAGNFHALAEKFDFSRYETLCDVGGATGQLSRDRSPPGTRTCAARPSTCRRSSRSPSARSKPPGSAIG